MENDLKQYKYIHFLDVGYNENGAKAVRVTEHLATGNIEIEQKQIHEVAEYVPGEFYKRELPCLLEVLKSMDKYPSALIVIDGYVFLDEDNTWGLGAHLHHELGEETPVIGIAKKYFKGVDNVSAKVYRGESRNPLYVSAVGIELNKAVNIVASLKGKYRIPDVIKFLDRLTKEP